MAAKNLLKTSDYVPNDDILVGIISQNPPYKICYQLGTLLAKKFVINLKYNKKSNQRGFPEKSINFEYFRWKSESKGKTIFLVPNRQEIGISENIPNYPSLYANEDMAVNKTMVLIPAWKQIDYILRFEGFEHPEILEIADKIKKSKMGQMVVVSQTSKVENAVTLYFFD
jgi:hypothetical protein